MRKLYTYSWEEAVFNSHIGDAGQKTKEEKFGLATWNRELADFERDGIMIIFNHAPTKFTKWYVFGVTRRVNNFNRKAKRSRKTPQ